MSELTKYLTGTAEWFDSPTEKWYRAEEVDRLIDELRVAHSDSITTIQKKYNAKLATLEKVAPLAEDVEDALKGLALGGYRSDLRISHVSTIRAALEANQNDVTDALLEQLIDSVGCDQVDYYLSPEGLDNARSILAARKVHDALG